MDDSVWDEPYETNHGCPCNITQGSNLILRHQDCCRQAKIGVQSYEIIRVRSIKKLYSGLPLDFFAWNCFDKCTGIFGFRLLEDVLWASGFYDTALTHDHDPVTGVADHREVM